MTELVIELARRVCGPGQDEELLRLACEQACRTLDGRLRDGVSAEDCQGAYPLAAAWLAADWLREGRGLSGVTALSAGDISVRREGGGESGRLSRRAMELMAPYLKEQEFVFRGVEG